MRVVLRRTRSTPRSAIVLLALACGMLAATIGASSASAAVNGALKQLPLPSGCLDDAGAGGCANVNAPMSNVGEPSMLPNGSVIYVPARGSNTVNYFSRNATTGALTEKGCLSFAVVTGCTVQGVSPLDDATATAVSPDGKDLYVVGGAADGGQPDGIAHFTLAPDGTPSLSECFNANATTGCAGLPLFNGANPASVAVSPDGRSVYVGNYNNGSIAVFKRNTTSGVLNQAGLTAAQKCIKSVGDADGCTVVPRLGNPRDVEMTPDDKQLLIASDTCNTAANCFASILAFDRADPTTSVLTIDAANGSCISGAASIFGQTCMNRNIWFGSTQLAISPNGNRIYANTRPSGASGYSSIQTATRNATTGDLTPAADWCIEYPNASTDCTPTARGLNDVFDVAIGPNGDVYTAGYGGQRVGVFNAAADGKLTPKPGAFGCLAQGGVDTCGSLLGGTNVEYVLPSPDSRNVYGFGLGKVWSFAVDHAPVCDTASVDTPHNTAVTITLPCSDADGDPLNYEIVSQPGKGQFAAAGIQGNKITYGPLIGTSGPDSFQYRATGAGVQADTATMTVNVGAPPPPPPPPPPTGGGGGGGGGQTGGGGGVQVDPTQILFAWPFAFSKSTKKYTVFTALALKAIPIGATVKVVCKSPKGKCPGGSSFTKNNAFGTVKLKKWIKKKIRAGTKITATVTKPGNYIGAVKIMTVRKKNRPKFTDRCLPPGTTRPVGC
jgi:hypothetical protein